MYEYKLFYYIYNNAFYNMIIMSQLTVTLVTRIYAVTSSAVVYVAAAVFVVVSPWLPSAVRSDFYGVPSDLWNYPYAAADYWSHLGLCLICHVGSGLLN